MTSARAAKEVKAVSYADIHRKNTVGQETANAKVSEMNTFGKMQDSKDTGHECAKGRVSKMGRNRDGTEKVTGTLSFSLCSEWSRTNHQLIS